MDDIGITEYHAPQGIGILHVIDTIQKVTAFGDWIVSATSNSILFFKAQITHNIIHFKLESSRACVATSFCWMNSSVQKLLVGTESGYITLFRFGEKPENIHTFDAHRHTILEIIQWNLSESSKCLFQATESGFVSSDSSSIKIWKVFFSRKKTCTEILHIITCPEASFLSLLKIGSDYIWTGMSNSTINVWKRNGDDLECSEVLQQIATDHLPEQLLLLEHNVVSANRQHILLWSLSGELLGTYPAHHGANLDLSIWHGWLCTVSMEEIFLWNFHQSRVNKVAICAQNIRGLVYWKHDSREFLCTFFGNNFTVWEEFVIWDSIRVLWIGWMKNLPSDCIMASLPKDVLKIIIGLLGRPLLKKSEGKQGHPKYFPFHA